MNNIAERIKYILEQEGLTYNQFAERIGVASSAVSHFVNRRNKPSLDAIAGILDAFPNISPDWLVLGTGSPQRDIDFAANSVQQQHKAITQRTIELPKTEREKEKDENLQPSSTDQPHEEYLGRRAADMRILNDTTHARAAEIHGNPIEEGIVAPDTRICPVKVITIYSDGTFESFTLRKSTIEKRTI